MSKRNAVLPVLLLEIAKGLKDLPVAIGLQNVVISAILGCFF